MSDVLGRWNELSAEAAEAEVLACNGSRAWVRGLAARRPFASEAEVLAVSDEVWDGLSEADWMEAFATHPRIGERHAAAASATSLAWSTREQAVAERSDASETERLAAGNRTYEARFGRTFLICATGKTKAEILAALEARMERTDEEETMEAAEQQRQITRIRLRRWLGGE
jgi:2-oxo-4-hydroxy-4-carboxy-5-ureidoimidazoline decarboxylase